MGVSSVDSMVRTPALWTRSLTAFLSPSASFYKRFASRPTAVDAAAYKRRENYPAFILPFEGDTVEFIFDRHCNPVAHPSHSPLAG
jgi:hypothetical protein